MQSTGFAQWGANGTGICMAANNQKNPQLCYNTTGTTIITWFDERTGSNGDIYAQKLDSNGNAL